MRASIVGVVLLLGSALALAQTAEPRRLLVGGVELHYIEQGQGEPLILLHGGQGDYRAWQEHIEALAPTYRVISYSRRYHYPNQNPIERDHSARVDAEDLAALLAELNLDPVHLVGTSYGAFTALALAVSEPDRVRSLVLAEPPIHGWAANSPNGAALYRTFMTSVHEPAGAAFFAGDDEAAMRILIDAFDGSGAFARLSAARRAAIMQNARFFEAITASSDAYPSLPKDALAQLDIPVLIIRGANTDDLHKFATDELARVLRKATLAVIPEAGHGSPRQNAPAFIANVVEFLNGVERARRTAN
jgi:pimeloyl-ACP methyl ester carboxylesterase